jgi:pilus assembly protein CpaB
VKYQDFLKVIIAAAVGAAIGGGAVFYLTTPREIAIPHVVAEPETVRLLVARQALSYGATLQPGNLQWVEWPKSAVPPGAFTSVEELLGEKGDQKRIVLRSIEPGEPVLENKITKFGESPRMSMNLNSGMRAVSISIDAVSGVAGFVAPGDRVDILLTRTQQGQLVSSVILQDITVIAVDQRQNAEATKARLGSTVTVEVDTVQAQKLALARQVGKLSLTLRGIGEVTEEPLAPVTVDSLSNFERAIEPRAGMRAFSINIDAVFDVAGFVAAGDRVNILLTRAQEGQLVSSVILRDIIIIAVDQRANSKMIRARFGRTVTVEVDTVQAKKLALAQQEGKLSLTLHGLRNCPRDGFCGLLHRL